MKEKQSNIFGILVMIWLVETNINPQYLTALLLSCKSILFFSLDYVDIRSPKGTLCLYAGNIILLKLKMTSTAL